MFTSISNHSMQNRFTTYLTVAKKLIESYKGEVPLSAYLKNYFSAHKKHGSTDRKQIAHWCYCYFRIGKSLIEEDTDLRIRIAYFLCNENCIKYEHLFDEFWLDNWNIELEKRIAFVKSHFRDFLIEDIFVTNENISLNIDKIAFVKSHLQQPNLFVRIRLGKEKNVENKLNKSEILYNKLTSTCLSFPNATKIENTLIINKEVVIQDYSSQQVGELMQIVKSNIKQPIFLWDCCAASGGKTILAKDVLENATITVSDIRTSIIANLRKRFEEAGINKFESFVLDATKPITTLKKKFNFIICDVPCTGSGTWARTPEELYFFKEEKIDEFHHLQLQIASNASQHLMNDGYLLYMTCSVFEEENEMVVEKIMQQNNFELVEQKYFTGYSDKADNMFAALFKKNS